MKNVFQAILKFQSLISTVKADSENPHFKSVYVSLEGLIQAVQPHLQVCGLIYMHIGKVDAAGNQICEAVISHAQSGESVSSQMICPVSDNNPQKLASAWSYARRYTLMGALGIASEDDDANKATPVTSQPKSYEPKKADENNLWGACVEYGWVTKTADGKWNYSKEFNSLQNFYGVKKLNEAPQHLKHEIFFTLSKGPHFVEQKTLGNDDLPF